MFNIIFRKVTSAAATEEASRKFWNSMANYYTKYNLDLSNKNYEAIAPFLNLEQASSVLDAGCGPGNGSQILSRFGKSSLKFSLIDISDEFVSRCKNTCGPNVEVKKANAESLPFKPNTFDAYVASGLLEIVDNPEWVISEAHRTLKPGGKAAFSLYGRMGICNVLRIYKILNNSLRIEKGTFKPRFELSDPEKVKNLMKTAGFENCISFYEQYHYPQLTVEELFMNYWDNPILLEEAKAQGKEKQLEAVIKEELTNILEVKEEPLIFESLIIIANKPN